MDYEDKNEHPDSMAPVAPVYGVRAPKKARRHEAEVYDRDRAQWEAWQLQKKLQKKRRFSDVQRLEALENATAAADLKMAASGLDCKVALRRRGEEFQWVVSSERSGKKVVSEIFDLYDVNPKTIAAVLESFLKSKNVYRREIFSDQKEPS